MNAPHQHPAYLEIEDHLDAIGQRYRVFCLVRGTILFAALTVGVVVVTGLLASLLGPGWATTLLAILSLVILLTGFALWVIRPLAMRPKALDMARMVEGRVTDVHNALSNGVLLTHADDLRANPWLDPILRELARTAGSRPLHEAVRFKDLRKPAFIAWGIALPLLVLGILLHGRVLHGISQATQPQQFVPMVGEIKLLDVRPGNTTVIKGKSLEVTAVAQGPGDYAAKVFFDGDSAGQIMSASPGENGTRRFGFVRDHVDANTRYRVEVGGTQSPWYEVTVVQQIGLTGIILTITPPAYTRQPPQTITLAPVDLDKQTFAAPQGSKITLAFDTDIPMAAGMVQFGEDSPAPANRSPDGKRFSADLFLRDTVTASLLLTDGAGQILARQPEHPIRIDCKKDAAPTIEMKWPRFDLTLAPTNELTLEANLKDDYGLTGAKLIWGVLPDEPGQAAGEKTFVDQPATLAFAPKLTLPPGAGAHGKSIWIQIQATDNRDLIPLSKDLGPQTSTGKRVEIRFRDPEQLNKETLQKIDKLREKLEALLKKQKALHETALGLKRPDPVVVPQVHQGQQDVKAALLNIASTFEFGNDDRLIQKTLQVLAGGSAQEAVDYAHLILTEKDPAQFGKLSADLQARQRRVIQTLENLLALLRAQAEATTQPAGKRGGQLDSPADAFKKLDEALKQFVKEEQRILDQTASLAKKPVDNFDDQDKKLLAELQQSQEKLDAFMQQKVSDFSNVAEQDMANASMLKELLATYSEVTMAKDALNQKAMEMAVAAEQNGLELAKETSSNLEKWLADTPDRQKWTQEDQIQKAEAPMPELPAELEDMVGELMEKQEDLFDEMEDANANWHDSLDKGAGWDAADGPIDNMSAKGITGNVLPNNNEMGGRSGEGRSGKSQGEMVGDSAVGKGGRNTPTRLDPTAFQQGQIEDTSKDPVGGATGGGKLSGQGAAGLEGPTAPQMKQQMERLKQRQAELRNSAERLNLQYKVGSYDNFKLLEAVAIMRRVESDLNANRYQNALRRKDVLLDALDNSRTLLGGQISVQHDTTPAANRKLQQDINDAMKGNLPPAWETPLKEYYRKLGEQ